MKKILLFALVAALAACGGKKTEVSPADARIDSLQRVLDQKDNELNDVMATFNEIQEGFRLIEASQDQVSVAKAGEGADKKEQMRQSIRNIQQRMQHNQELIAKLQKQVRDGNVRSAELKKTVEGFVKELEAKNAELTSLRAELEQKNIHIAELDQTVADLNTSVSSLQEETAQKQETINQQDRDLNTVYYVYGTKKELKAHGIYDSGKVLRGSYDKNYFTKVDMRNMKEVKIVGSSPKVLTAHPANSYTLERVTKNEYTLRITDAASFWSASKYLVVKVS